MPHTIHVLSDTLINQIAAGEVIQRPASVVKELLENAIDAQADHIQVKIKAAGKNLIQVIDDGIGMHEQDAQQSFLRHATSKLKKVDDLFALHTMGFRGEALASIAAVSQVVMHTKRQADELGITIPIDGGAYGPTKALQMSHGTNISVKNLFFNVPARRQFLKSSAIETKHIIDAFQRVALAYPQTAFTFYQQDNLLYQLAPAKLSHRIVQLLGKNYQSQLIPCDTVTEHVHIKGYIGKPEQAKKTRGEQFFFVNQRFIKHHALHHAIKTAFENLIPNAYFPFYALFIDIDPKCIDINVHPHKTEIKFADERMMYAMVDAAVRKALSDYQMTPALDFNHNVNHPLLKPTMPFTKNMTTATQRANTHLQTTTAKRYTQQDWDSLLKDITAQHQPSAVSMPPAGLFHVEAPPLKTNLVTSDATASNQEHLSEDIVMALQQPTTTNALTTSLPTQHTKHKIQLQDQYIITSLKSGLLCVDQQAAHERILYEKFLKALQQQPSTTQQLLFPQTITLNPADVALLEACLKDIQQLGFALQITSQDQIHLTGCPAEVAEADLQSVIEGFLEEYKAQQVHLKLPQHERMARALAKRSGISYGKTLTNTEMDSLIDQLFGCTHPAYTPSGNITWVILPTDQLQQLFQVT